MGVKYDIDRWFFKFWTPQMSYVLGFITADGSLEDASYLRGKYIRICSSDLEIIKKIKAAMHSKHKVVRIEPKEIVMWGKQYVSREKYMLRIGSHELYNDLVTLGLTPAKSKTITLPDIPKDFVQHFVRGYLDGDGCISVYSKKKRLSVTFTSGSPLFLRQLSSLIAHTVGLTTHNVFSNNRAFQIKYSTREALSLLSYIYVNSKKDLQLERKFQTYSNFLSAYPQWGSETLH